jgi:hypothetical protein
MELASRGQEQDGFPRIYRVEETTRRFFYGLALFLVALFFAMTVAHLEGFMRRPLPLSQLIAMDSFISLIVLSLCFSTSRRVILYHDGIEVAGWFSTRKLTREQIRGRRMGRLPGRAGGGSYYIIVPLAGEKEMKLPPFLSADKCFFLWMKTIPMIKE